MKILFFTLFVIGAMVAVISPPIDATSNQTDLLAGELGKH